MAEAEERAKDILRQAGVRSTISEDELREILAGTGSGGRSSASSQHAHEEEEHERPFSPSTDRSNVSGIPSELSALLRSPDCGTAPSSSSHGAAYDRTVMPAALRKE